MNMKKRFLLLTACVLAFSVVWADKLSNHYVMQYREDSKLFFFMPINIPCEQKSVPHANMDVTYFTNQDTATVNMTIRFSSIISAQKIAFVSGENEFAITEFETFYVEREKKNWEHRYSCRVPYEQVRTMFLSQSSFELIVESPEVILKYRMNAQGWKKHVFLAQIVYMIEMNK